MNNKLQAIIFDMDGVLIESTVYVWESFNILFKEYGVQVPDNEVGDFMGNSLRDQIRMIRDRYNIKEEIDHEQFSKDAFEIEQDLMQSESQVNEYLISFIKDAKKAGVSVGVATSSTSARAKSLLKLVGVYEHMDCVVTADDVSEHKPDPEIFLTTAEQLGAEPGACVVIEDARQGIEAAKRAGMKAVAKVTRFSKKEDFPDVDMVIHNISELSLPALRSLFL